jgi:microcin C transport system substrate-binding protein
MHTVPSLTCDIQGFGMRRETAVGRVAYRNLMTRNLMTRSLVTHSLIVLLALLVTACGDPADTAQPLDANGMPAAGAPDVTAEVDAFYRDNPDFFTFASPTDLPDGLNWQDGSSLPDIGSSDAIKGGTEYARLQDFPRTFRTVGPDSNGSFRVWILDDVQMSLAHRHPDEFDFFPGLAKSWAVDREAKTVYVKLNPAARWSDGEAITADDFMFMFFFYRSQHIVAPWYNNWYGTQYTNITKYDDHTMAVSIPEAKPNMSARVLGLSPKPRHFYSEFGPDFVERYQWRFPPTTAAYVIHDKDIKKGRSVTLTRDSSWWAKDLKFWRNRFNTDRIHLSVIRDTPKVFEAFKRGDIDQFSLNLAEYWYEKLPDDDADVESGYIHKSVFYNIRPRPTWGLWINSHKPLLDNPDVRIGLNHSTNWQLVIDKYFRGDYTRMRTSSDGFADFTHPGLQARQFDIEKAAEYFSRAGFDRRGDKGILTNAAGVPLSFTLSTGYENLKDALTILKEEAAKAGVEFRIEVLDSTSGWKKVQEKNHDIHLVAFSVSLEMYPRFWETYHSVNAYNNAFADDGSINPERKVKTQTNNLEMLAMPEMDVLVDRYRASESREEMVELAHRMTEIHHGYASFIPGYVQPFYRTGYWRWVRYPDNFNHKHSRSATQLFIHWIDQDMKKATQTARADGVSFPPARRVYDQFSK